MIPRHPTQIYEALAYLIIFFILFKIYQNQGWKLRRGYLLGLFLTLVFGFRFFVEFLKENQVNFEAGMALNMGQILSIPAVIAGLILIFQAKEPDPGEQPKPSKKKK